MQPRMGHPVDPHSTSGCMSQKKAPLVGPSRHVSTAICSRFWLSLMPIHVCQPGKAGSPISEVVIVLVLISQAGQDGAQCPCHRAISLVVIDERCVVGGHAGVAVCSLQALWRSPQTSGPLGGKPGATARPRSASGITPEGNLLGGMGAQNIS